MESLTGATKYYVYLLSLEKGTLVLGPWNFIAKTRGTQINTDNWKERKVEGVPFDRLRIKERRKALRQAQDMVILNFNEKI